MKFQRCEPCRDLSAAFALAGDVHAMHAMGDLLYWGARGLDRNQPEAFSYFEAAASQGNVPSKVGRGLPLLSTPRHSTTALAAIGCLR